MKLSVVKPIPSNLESNPGFVIFTRGGLGDSIKRYLGYGKHGDGWEYLLPLKEKHPNAIIKLITLSANSQTPHFFMHHPLIDCIYEGKWMHPQGICPIMEELKGDNFKLICSTNVRGEYTEAVSGLTPTPQSRFYYSSKDISIINSLSSAKPYIVLHPFAGEANRMVMPIEEYYELVPQLAKLGITIIVVGANWVKPHTYYSGHNVKEAFNYKHPMLINLIDKVNPRVVIGLIEKAKCLISVRSYCFSATKSGRINSILLTSANAPQVKYLTPRQVRENLLDSAFGWSEQTINQRIKIIGVGNDYTSARNTILNNVSLCN